MEERRSKLLALALEATTSPEGERALERGLLQERALKLVVDQAGKIGAPYDTALARVFASTTSAGLLERGCALLPDWRWSLRPPPLLTWEIALFDRLLMDTRDPVDPPRHIELLLCRGAHAEDRERAFGALSDAITMMNEQLEPGTSGTMRYHIHALALRAQRREDMLGRQMDHGLAAAMCGPYLRGVDGTLEEMAWFQAMAGLCTHVVEDAEAHLETSVDNHRILFKHAPARHGLAYADVLMLQSRRATSRDIRSASALAALEIYQTLAASEPVRYGDRLLACLDRAAETCDATPESARLRLEAHEFWSRQSSGRDHRSAITRLKALGHTLAREPESARPLLERSLQALEAVAPLQGALEVHELRTWEVFASLLETLDRVQDAETITHMLSPQLERLGQ